jgi:hypothetical protein
VLNEAPFAKTRWHRPEVIRLKSKVCRIITRERASERSLKILQLHKRGAQSCDFEWERRASAASAAAANASFLLRLSSLILRIQIPFHFCNGFTSPIVVIKTSSLSSTSSHSRAKNEQRGFKELHAGFSALWHTFFVICERRKIRKRRVASHNGGWNFGTSVRPHPFFHPAARCQHSEDKRHTYLYIRVCETLRGCCKYDSSERGMEIICQRQERANVAAERGSSFSPLGREL